MDELIAQYTGADENSRLTRQNITKIEFDTTMHLLAPYLKSGADVCELGAATGRYSLSFAKMGCTVTSVELVPDQVEILKKNAERKDLTIDIHLGSACHVPFIESGSQDICVILGPLYHLKIKSERDQAISEAKRILKPNGILAVAYISRFFVAGLFAQKFPHLVTPSILSELYTNGTVTASEADRFSELATLPLLKKLNICCARTLSTYSTMPLPMGLVAISQKALIALRLRNIKHGWNTT